MATSEPPYRFETASGYTVVVIQPQLNDSQWSDFEVVGNELLNRIGDVKPPAVLIDLSGLSYMGSAMVALIVRLWKAIRERGGKMVVINRHEMVFEVMKLAGLNNVWTIVPDRDQALKALGKRSSGGGQSSGGMLLGLGALGVIVAAVGLAMTFGVIPGPGTPKVSTAVTVAGALLGLVGGTVSAARGSGGAKNAGVLIAIASAAILILGIVLTPPARGSATDGPASGSNAESKGSPSAATNSSATDDGESKRKKKRENRKESKSATATADAAPTDVPNPADAPKAGEPVKVGENLLPVIETGPATNPAAEPPPENAADLKDKEGAEKKPAGGFGSAKQLIKDNEKK